MGAPIDYDRRVGTGSLPADDGLPSLAAIERRRRRLWLITGFFLMTASGVVAVTLTDVAVAEHVPDIPAVRWGLFALASAFLLYVFDQERLLRGLTRAFLAHDIQTATLESRILDLTTLTRLGHSVNSVLTISDVVEAVLGAATELAGARNGSVMLREDERLRVMSSAGPEAAPAGVEVALGEGLAGEVAANRRPLLVSGQLEPGERAEGRAEHRAFGSSVIVPLIARDDVVGVLSLERPAGKSEFNDLDLHSIALFADHAGAAISNAQRFESERDTATRLTDVLELRSEFVAALVHDLKNPINAILGYTSLLHDRWAGLGDQGRGQALAAVSSEGERLLHLVEEVLHSTSVDAGAELRLVPVLVADLLQPLVDAAEVGTRAQEGVQRDIRLQLAPGCETASVHGDPQALRHVFTNLLDNAVKYSPPGSPVDVQVNDELGQVCVAVRDRGRGIAAEDLPHVFERFRQVPGEGRTGVGLGLYIARTLVTAHGGRISITSTEGGGSTFQVRLPHPEADESLATAGSTAL